MFRESKLYSKLRKKALLALLAIVLLLSPRLSYLENADPHRETLKKIDSERHPFAPEARKTLFPSSISPMAMLSRV